MGSKASAESALPTAIMGSMGVFRKCVEGDTTVRVPCGAHPMAA